MKKLVMFGIFVSLSGTLGAQEFPRFTFNAGAGFTTPVGTTGDSLDTGWNVRGGVGYNFLPWVGANIDFGFDKMGVNSTTLGDLGYGGGSLRVFSATFDPIVHLTPKHRVDLYVTGGGGYFWEQQQFTDPGVASGIFGNPFFGYYPGTFVTNVVVSSYSVNKPGLDAGVGVQFGSKWGGHFFAEARYVRIFTGRGVQTDYLPVTFGFRR
jgi:Outer membrane protein beta-barrel domain